MTRYDPATADFSWLLRHVVRLDDILMSSAFPGLDVETADQLIDAAGEFITDVIAPINVASDQIGATLQSGRVVTAPGWLKAYKAWCANGWPSLGAPEAYGGQGMPFLIQACVATMLGGADLAFAMVSASARGAASVLLAHGGAALRETCVPRLASGEWAATIAMTEPQAGSDVGLLRTKAIRRAGGGFELTGSKIFISGGDHDLTDQILHIVLARIEGAPPGTRGLSLFLVPSRDFAPDGTLGDRNAVSVARLEEKLGLHGSATCVLDFDQAGATLIGRENEGLAAMFVMMSELRLETALSAVGIGASATAHARAYAEERRQGRSSRGGVEGPAPIIDHPDVRRMVSIMGALTEGGRALALETARLIDLSRVAPDPEARARAERLVALLLPICKATLSDDAVEVASLGVQIRGGHGYVRESGAEQFLRDVRVLPIYEGTNGIQAIDLVMRKLKRDGGASMSDLTDEIGAELARSAGQPALRAIHAAMQTGLASLERASATLLTAQPAQEEAVLAGAGAYLSLAGRVCLGWMWLRMAAAPNADEDVLAHKRAMAEFFALYYEPEFELHTARVLRALQGPGAGPTAQTS
jgi:acyl-CoA dehydrogenase